MCYQFSYAAAGWFYIGALIDFLTGIGCMNVGLVDMQDKQVIE